jgi:signal transduction histidine kinase
VAYGAFIGGICLSNLLHIYPLRVRPAVEITLFECAVLALVARRAASSHTWAASYLGFEMVCQAAIFHFLGDVRLGVAPFVYAFELLNPGLRLGRGELYVFANGCVVLLAGIVLLESRGALERIPLNGAYAPMLTIFTTFACMNLAAYLAHGIGRRSSELEAAYRALRAKEEELRDFAYASSHDVKNRVNAILVLADSLEQCEGERLTPSGRIALKELIERSVESEDMLRDLFDLFNITSASEPVGNVPLAGVVEETLAVLAPQVTAKGIHVTVAGSLPDVRGQRKKLGHLFRNLLDNAAKYAPSVGGEVSVTAEEGADGVIVCVRDNGIGIPPEWQTAIFDVFRRAPGQAVDGQPVKGSGVGLAVVKRVAEAHGGSVWVESEPGKGSRFYVRLPLPNVPRDAAWRMRGPSAGASRLALREV